MTTHQMTLEKEYPTGAQEWHCPACSRRMMITIQPYTKWILLELGNENVTHKGDNISSVEPTMSEVWQNGLKDIEL